MIIRALGTQPYTQVWGEMKAFTLKRDAHTEDEVWLVEHPAVYTQGQAGKSEHVLNAMAIPIVQSDRGGQVTYHGPGQLVVYFLMNLTRRNLTIRGFVRKLEHLLIQCLAEYQITAISRCDAPGVYVLDKKIASIGLRVKNGCTYHGIALNVNMDLTPFRGINPCGFAKLEMTQMQDFCPTVNIASVSKRIIQHIQTEFKE